MSLQGKHIAVGIGGGIAAYKAGDFVRELRRQGASVRVYSPTVKEPAFAPKGDLVHIPWFPIPGRSEYKVGYMIPPRVKRDLKAFRPNIFHVSSPEILGHRAVSLAHRAFASARAGSGWRRRLSDPNAQHRAAPGCG